MDDALGIGRTQREIGLVVVRTYREAYIIRDVGTGLEEIFRAIA